MKWFRARRPSPALVISLVALLLATAGGATAATLITGKQIKNSSVTGKDVKNKSLTAKDFKGSVRGTRGRTGVQGAQGPKGDTGAQGAAGPGARWVLVRGSDGVVLATNDTSITVTRDAGGGFYFANFGSSVASKLLVATLNRTGGAQLGQITAGPCGGAGAPGGNSCAQSNNVNTVLVQTSDSAGTTTDRNFFLSVVP